MDLQEHADRLPRSRGLRTRRTAQRQRRRRATPRRNGRRPRTLAASSPGVRRTTSQSRAKTLPRISAERRTRPRARCFSLSCRSCPCVLLVPADGTLLEGAHVRQGNPIHCRSSRRLRPQRRPVSSTSHRRSHFLGASPTDCVPLGCLWAWACNSPSPPCASYVPAP